MPQQLFLETNSSGQTKKFAGFLASNVASRKNLRLLSVGGSAKNALVLALSGDLGSGKTTFIQGFLKGLGVCRKITSPTFVIAKRYKLKTKSYKLGYHIDCYRIKKSKELLDLGLKEILNNPENVVLIEWPEKIKKTLPKDSIWIKFKHSQKINQRTITFIRK